MNLTNEQVDQINYAARCADIEPTAYSGRAMYGRYCLGLPVENFTQAAEFFVNLAEEDADTARSLARNMRTDSLGLGLIVYFPAFESGDHWSNEDEDEYV